MLRYALTENGTLISVEETASPPYFCPDCLSLLGKKMGPERAWHFFHFDGEEKRNCKRRGDTQEHQALQNFLLQTLKEQNPNWVMEYPIKPAQRVADLALPSEKIALEIQRSSLSLESFLQRSEAFWKNGWSVIWFLSLSLYRSSSLPRKVQEIGIIPHYFFEEGELFPLWDILSLKKGQSMHRKIATISIVQRAAVDNHCHSFYQFPTVKKRNQWPIHIKGDFLDDAPEEPITLPPQKKKLKTWLSLLWLRLIGT